MFRLTSKSPFYVVCTSCLRRRGENGPVLTAFNPPFLLSLQNPDMLTRKIKLCHINAHITCRLCEGYLIDATTVTECLHTCESCPHTHLSFPNSSCNFGPSLCFLCLSGAFFSERSCIKTTLMLSRDGRRPWFCERVSANGGRFPAARRGVALRTPYVTNKA